MNKTRFQMPPRAGSAADINQWIGGDTAADASWSDSDAEPPPDTVTELFGPMKIPLLFDIAALFEVQRRNVEALTAANRVAWTGVVAVARRNLEIVQQTMADVSDTVRTLASPECPGARAMRQTETLIKACDDAAANVKALREIMQHAGVEAMEVLNRRFAEAVDEVKASTRCSVRDFWGHGWPASFAPQT